MAYAKLTLKELKSICKDNHLKNYSALNKTELIAFIKKNKKMKQNKKKVGGFDGVLNRDTLRELLGNISEDELMQKTTIDLSGKKIEKIDSNTFKGLTSLQTLFLNNNQITTIKTGVFNGLTNLENLSLEKNQITTIQTNTSNELTSLQVLFLSNNEITTIEPNIFKKLTSLQYLLLSNNQITTIEPDIFKKLTNLKELYLSDNQIETIERDTFNELTNLENLYLNDNQITTIETGVFNGLTNLENLSLEKNQITTIERNTFNGLTKLKRLNLDYNEITTIEQSAFNDLTNIQVLVLYSNQINTIQTGVFNGLTKLKELYLGNNQITTIQPGIFRELTNLKRLNLERIQITTIQPNAFNGLTNLENLYLNDNQITTIQPGAFNELTNLKILDLGKNQITTIEPGAFNGLRNLERQTLIIDINSLNETSRNYYFRFINPNPNIRNKLLITKNMLNTSKNNNKYHNHKLYNYILTIDDNTLTKIRFKFEGQTGINAGGLTRTVYDIFYHSYIKKFFEVNSNGSYYINKTKINDNNKENIITATYKLIILAKKGSVQIVIPIHETLMEILKSENPTNTINLTNKNKYNDSNTLTNTTRKYNENTKNSKISNVIAINNGNTTFNINWNNIKNNDTKENTKKEIFLRRYLNSMGFKKYTDFEYMHTWFKKCWKDDIFITKLSFTKKDFFKRIKITKLQDGNKPRQEYNLSPNNNSSNLINKFLNSNNGKQLIQEYPNLKVILDYINQEDDEYRKIFNKHITGSIYNNGIMNLLLINGNNTNKPYFGHTCSITLDIYKINPNKENQTTLTNNKFKIYVIEKTMSN